jgi:hypothetical protein
MLFRGSARRTYPFNADRDALTALWLTTIVPGRKPAKTEIHEMVIGTVRRLSRGAGCGRYRGILIRAVVRGGGELRETANGYGDALKRLWERTDHVVKSEIKGYQRRLPRELAVSPITESPRIQAIVAENKRSPTQ